MPFTGMWVGEGGGTFSGESTTEAQLMTYAAQTASTVNSVLSSVNTIQTWLNAWRAVVDVTLTDISSAIATHDSAIQTQLANHDANIAGLIRDLVAKVDLYEDRSRQRYEQTLAAINNASASIQAYLGQEVDNLEARLAEMRTDIGTINRVLNDTYARCGTINENLVQHDTNLVGRTQQIYDRCGAIQNEVGRIKTQLDNIQDEDLAECQVKLRTIPKLFNAYSELILSPFYDSSRIDETTWRTTVNVDSSPYLVEGRYNYDYRVATQGISPGLDASSTASVSVARLRAVDAYGKFKSVVGNVDLYFSEQLPTVLTWPYRIYGDGGHNID